MRPRAKSAVISFGSPKGGAGRTMLVANLAVLFARGCRWAGLQPATVLSVDLDFQAPGLHFFDFASRLGATAEITVAGERVPDWKSAVALVAERPLGMLHWLSATTGETRAGRHGQAPPGADAVAGQVTTILANSAGRPDLLTSADAHLVRVLGPDGGDLLLFPAADPRQPAYAGTLLNFDPLRCFEEQSGYAALDALYAHILARFTSELPQRVLLDQGGGLSIPGAVNRAYADHHVIVSGLNEQHRAGLAGMLTQDSVLAPARTSIVLSQYGARRLADGSYTDRERFLAADDARRTLSALLAPSIVPTENVHVIDFELGAVGQEFFFADNSEAFDELLGVAVAIERQGEPLRAEDPPWEDVPELLVLGEYVGLAGDPPSGALGGFASWLQSTLGEKCKVRAFAATHEGIGEIAKRRPSADSLATSTRALAPTASTGPVVIEDDARDKCCLSDFDIVAMPLYLAEQVADQLDELLGFAGRTEFASDAIGPVGEDYACTSIHGWRDYAWSTRGPQSPKLLGYPLFVDHQLLVVNGNNLGSTFREIYARNELREFRGFSDPADLIAAARVALATGTPRDGLLLALDPTSVARWYEWRTLMGMMRSPGEPTRLTGERAMLAYFELCRYADPDSARADWDMVHQAFFGDQAAGLLLVWPDAIPLEARRAPRHVYQYLRPPGQCRFEECWLLVVPRNRGFGRPSAASIEALLRRFLTPSAQQVYLDNGGLPVHRRVLRSIDNWRRFAFLPPLRWWDDRTTQGQVTEVTRAADASRMAEDLEALAELAARPLAEVTPEAIAAAFARSRTKKATTEHDG